jgi:hypothetical protein
MSPGWRRSHDQRSIDKVLVNLRFLIDKLVAWCGCAAGVVEEDPHVAAEGVVVAVDPGVGVAGRPWVSRCRQGLVL